MLIGATLLVAIHAASPTPPLATPVARRCTTAPHEYGRVRRMPGQAMTTDRPRDPSEDVLPHCAEAEAPPEAPPPGRPRPGRRG